LFVTISNSAWAQRESSENQLPRLWERPQLTLGIDVGERFSKHGDQSLDAYTSCVAQARRSTLRIFQDGEQVSLATIIRHGGFALAKASEVDRQKAIECRTSDDRSISARVADVAQPWDLVLLQFEDPKLESFSLLETKPPELGTLLVAGDTTEQPISVGTLSVAPRNLQRGFLGVQMDYTTENGVIVSQIVPNSAAEQAGLRAGDRITAIDGTAVERIDQVIQILHKKRPDDSISLQIVRDGQTITVEAVLGENTTDLRPSNRRRPDAVDPTINKRRTGFPRVMQHDLFLRPHTCGGPLLDLDGKLVGINIARYDRVTSYAIPIDQIAQMLDVDSSNQVRFAKPVSELLSDVEQAKKNVDATMAKLRESLEQYQAAQSALERAQQRSRSGE
jgi:serine protease Do